jgi:sugar phosphate isomerase/epimerase
VFEPIFGSIELPEMLDQVVEMGLDAVELACGGYPGDRHCRPRELLADGAARERLRRAVDERGLVISALSCHANPLHPDPGQAALADATFRDAVRLAADLQVGRVNTFAGCPGDGPDARAPNWVVTAWPPESTATLTWQWDEVVLPYWASAAAFARNHGVLVGIEMHPGFVVYNPRTLLRLRTAAGETIGANYDPSHLFWQGIDPVLAVEALGEAIVHVHAKDTYVDPVAVASQGVLDLDLTPGGPRKSYAFRSVGDGHGADLWARLVAALAAVGYDHVLSIEHEDPTRSVDEGLRRAAGVLRRAVDAITPDSGEGRA